MAKDIYTPKHWFFTTIIVIIVLIGVIFFLFDFQRTSSVMGIVKDVRTGQGIPDVLVFSKWTGKTISPFVPGEIEYQKAFAKTDSSGKYRIDGIVPYLTCKFIRQLKKQTIYFYHPLYSSNSISFNYSRNFFFTSKPEEANNIGSSKGIIIDISLSPISEAITSEKDLDIFYRETRRVYSISPDSIISQAHFSGIKLVYDLNSFIPVWDEIYKRFEHTRLAQYSWPSFKQQLKEGASFADYYTSLSNP